MSFMLYVYPIHYHLQCSLVLLRPDLHIYITRTIFEYRHMTQGFFQSGEISHKTLNSIQCPSNNSPTASSLLASYQLWKLPACVSASVGAFSA